MGSRSANDDPEIVMSGMGGGGGAPSFLQNSNLPSFNGPGASVAGAYGAMPGINAGIFGGGGPSQQPGGAPSGPGPSAGGMPPVNMQRPGILPPPSQMGGPMPPQGQGGPMPGVGMQRPGGPMPPQQMGGPQAGGLPPGFNPAMLQALMAHMQSQGAPGGMQQSMSGLGSMMGGYGGAPSPMQTPGGMAGMFPGMASRMGPMPQGGPQRQMPMTPGLLTR
jgi:hypothetical protein